MPRAQLGRDCALVRRVAEREEQADRHRLDIAHIRQARQVERCELAVGPDSARNAVRALERDERLGVPVAQAVEMGARLPAQMEQMLEALDRKSTRLNSSHVEISYAVFCLKKKKKKQKMKRSKKIE